MDKSEVFCWSLFFSDVKDYLSAASTMQKKRKLRDKHVDSLKADVNWKVSIRRVVMKIQLVSRHGKQNSSHAYASESLSAKTNIFESSPLDMILLMEEIIHHSRLLVYLNIYRDSNTVVGNGMSDPSTACKSKMQPW